MPIHPQEPHLYTFEVDNNLVAAVRAKSQAEARDYWIENHVVIERPTPIQAFRIGSWLAVDVENAKPEYAEPSDTLELFPAGVEAGAVVDPGRPEDFEGGAHV